MAGSNPHRTLVIACGALARELLDIVAMNGWDDVTVECLPAHLHNRPERIPDAVRDRIRSAGDRYDTVFVGYADCGTGGLLDAVIREEGVERLPGAHCYEFYAGARRFADLHDAEPGTFYLTDYLVKHFDRLVMTGLGIDRHPELLDSYFGNYTRLLYLAQTDDPVLDRKAEAAAAKLGLRYERIAVGYGGLETAMLQLGKESMKARA